MCIAEVSRCRVSEKDLTVAYICHSHNTLAIFRNVKIVTSTSDGEPVGMSPLVANITDALLQLVTLGATPHIVLQCLEDKLAEVYRQSHILANYLLGDTAVSAAHISMTKGTTLSRGGAGVRPKINPSRLFDLPSALGLDLNDLPLLLATASSHSPHLASMYGLSLR